MRTTLTLDDDVAAAIERLRKTSLASLKDIINDTLRKGLRHTASPPRGRKRARTESVSLGQCLIGSLDDVSEALAIAEGDSYR